MAHQIPVTDQAVAQVAMTVLLTQILAFEVTGEPVPGSLAGKLVEAASRVKFQPSTRQLVFTFNLDMSPTDEGTV